MLALAGFWLIIAGLGAFGVLKVTVHPLQNRSGSPEGSQVSCFRHLASAAAAEADAALMDGHRLWLVSLFAFLPHQYLTNCHHPSRWLSPP